MAEKLTNNQIATHYIWMNDTRRKYIELWLFNDKIELLYNGITYRIWPFRLWIPDIVKDNDGNDITKSGKSLKLIDLIDNYNLLFKINQTIYWYLKQFITFDNDNALPRYE